MVTAMQVNGLSCMLFVLRFFLLILLTAGFATAGHALPLDWDSLFTPVAKLDPAWSTVGSCVVAAALILRHSAKFRK